MAKRRPHGAGSVFRPTFRAEDGTNRTQAVWWIAYRIKGRLVRESTKTTIKAEAEALLRDRLHARDRGRLAAEAIKTTVADLQAVLEADYTANGQPVQGVRQRFRRLLEFFDPDQKADTVTATAVREYQKKRIEEKARPATINRELAALRRAFRIVAADGHLTVPQFSMLSEDNTRKGFFEREQFEAVRRHLPDWIQPLVTFLYFTGWRTGEAVRLEWNRVNLRRGIIRLEAGESRNGEARTLPFSVLPELVDVIRDQRELTSRLEHERGAIIPWVFHRDGQALAGDNALRHGVYKAWKAACKAAGLPGRLLHDFRRSAAMNLSRAGVPERVIMQLCGWKTRSVFDRYRIVPEKDLADGLARLAPLSAARRRSSD